MAVPQSLSPVTSSRPAPATDAVCPYLLASDGRWRSVAPAREHRCTALTPPIILAAEKQRRVCLVGEHLSCTTFRAAAGHTDLAAASPADPPDTLLFARANRTTSRDIVRTAPLVLDTGRLPSNLSGILRERGLGQGALLALMAVAFAAVLLARWSSGASPGDASGVSTGTATASPIASATTEPTQTPAPSVGAAPGPTLVPSEVQPTTPPAPSPKATTADPTDSPTLATTSYKVRRGDTLSGIAAEFGTTVDALARLNDIDDPSRLKVGQVLELP